MNGKILVTGGSGLLGSSFRKKYTNFYYPSSKELNLLDSSLVRQYINDNKFDTVIHLAGLVGGVKKNTERVYDFYYENSQMNNNVVNACVNGRIKKLVCCLSTCVYPEEKYVHYPLTEDQIHFGEPHASNLGYAYGKRMVDVLLRTARQQYGLEYISVIPNNLYGENDNFDLNDAHVIPALIRKIWEAKLQNKQTFDVWGDGNVFREFTYTDDIREAIMFCCEKYNDPTPINIGDAKEYSLKYAIELISKHLGYTGEIMYDASKPKGQVRKPSSNKRFIDFGWDASKYTTLDEGLRKTCNWFVQTYPAVRGI